MRVPSSVIFRRLVAAFFVVVCLAGSLGAIAARAEFSISKPEHGWFELTRMYDNTRGLLDRTEYADGTSERTLYDAEGRREYGGGWGSGVDS